jgi:hypothetical protein
MLARGVFHLQRREKHLKMTKKTKPNLGTSGPKEAAVEVVVVADAKVGEEVVEEEAATGKQLEPNSTPPILASTYTRRPGLSSLMIRWKLPGRPGKRTPPKKKRNVSALSMVRISTATSGDKSDQVKDHARREAAAIASVMAAKDILKALMTEKPTVMDMLTPTEAAMKPASKPTPASKKRKKSALKPLLVAINISATQRVVGGTVRISNSLAEFRAASAAKKVKDQEDRDAEEALVDIDED